MQVLSLLPQFSLGCTEESCALYPKLTQCPGVMKPAEFQSPLLWPQDACEHKSSRSEQLFTQLEAREGRGVIPLQALLVQRVLEIWYHGSPRWELRVAPPLPPDQEGSHPPLDVSLAKQR